MPGTERRSSTATGSNSTGSRKVFLVKGLSVRGALPTFELVLF